MIYKVYEINLCDVATLQCVFKGPDAYEKAKQMRALLYVAQDKCIELGEQHERMRYIIIED